MWSVDSKNNGACTKEWLTPKHSPLPMAERRSLRIHWSYDVADHLVSQSYESVLTPCGSRCKVYLWIAYEPWGYMSWKIDTRFSGVVASFRYPTQLSRSDPRDLCMWLVTHNDCNAVRMIRSNSIQDKRWNTGSVLLLVILQLQNSASWNPTGVKRLLTSHWESFARNRIELVANNAWHYPSDSSLCARTSNSGKV